MKSQNKQQKKNTQKKFKYFKDQNPIYFLDVFDYQNKTHYIISQSSALFFGFMEKYYFNLIRNISINSTVTSFIFDQKQNIIYFGLKNGSIMFGQIEAIYQNIPLKMIQPVDGKAILGLVSFVDEKSQNILLTMDTSSFKMYVKLQEIHKFKKQFEFKEKIGKVVVKSTSQLQQPCFMIQFGPDQYPLLLTLKQILKAFEEQETIDSWRKIRQQQYQSDQKPLTKVTAIDFNPIKKVVSIGYQNGVIQFLSIESRLHKNLKRHIMLPTLQVKQKQSILSLSLYKQTQSYLVFVNKKLLSGVNYQLIRSNPFSKIKNDSDRCINCIKWTKDKYFLMGSVSDSQKKLKPKVYCIEQEL